MASDRSDSLGSLLDPPPSGAIRCDMCGRFASRATATVHAEMGDYGQIYSYEFECQSCVAKSRSDHPTPEEGR